MDANEQARIAFLLIDYPVTILPYIGDQVDRRNRKTSIAAAIHQGHLKVGYENFGEVLALMGGDCEDLAKGITKVARALKNFITQSAGAKRPLIGEDINNKTSMSCLTRISALLDQFVIQMSLCVVHGAKADDNSSMPKGAHMADMGFPVQYFKECLERTKEGQRISAHLPWPKKIEDGLDFQIGEGTGNDFSYPSCAARRMMGVKIRRKREREREREMTYSLQKRLANARRFCNRNARSQRIPRSQRTCPYVPSPRQDHYRAQAPHGA